MRTAGLVILAILGLLYVGTRELAPVVNVRWSAQLDADGRRALQREYDLDQCTPSGERTDTCELLDTSRGNIAALVGDRRIEDTYHIDRATSRVEANADRAVHATWIAHRTPLRRIRGAVEALAIAGLVLVMVGPVTRRRARARDAGEPFFTFNVKLAMLAVAIFAVMIWATGRIAVEGGLGYDGRVYAGMLERGLTAGTRFTQMRPGIVILARIPYYFTQNVIASFDILNYAFVFLQAYLIAKLGDRYGITSVAKAYLVVSLALCISTAKMFAYYPVLIDLGGYVFITLAVYAVLVAPPRWAAIAVCAAVAAREFAIGVAFFGMYRAWRRREGMAAILAYVPAIAMFAFLRWFASGAEQGLPIATILVMNLGHWHERWYVAALIYFLLTTFGGISLILFARPQESVRFFLDEPEWALFAATVLGITFVFGIDVWRYLAFALPLIVAIFARASARWTPREQAWLLTIGAAATLYTQRPFERLTLEKYFRDWFPYYIAYTGTTPFQPSILWPAWQWRFPITAVLLVLLVASNFLRSRGTEPARQVAPASSI